jgi:hypothetical protein
MPSKFKDTAMADGRRDSECKQDFGGDMRCKMPTFKTENGMGR